MLKNERGTGMTKEVLEDGSVLYRFEVGEKARVKRSRYFHSHKTPMWANQYLCTIKRNNRTSVSVVIDGFENETHYVDPLDLIPLGGEGR